MKLWQKIFTATLALVIVVVNTTALVLLYNNHNLAIERERTSAKSRHYYLQDDLNLSVYIQQLNNSVMSLDIDDMYTVVSSVLDNQRVDNTSGAALFLDGHVVSSVAADPIMSQLDLLAAPNNSSRIVAEDYADGTKATYIIIVSEVSLNGLDYQLMTSYDVTSTYDLFAQQISMVRVVGIVSALVVAGILLLLVMGLLAPLRSLSNTTRQIARGDLEKRAPVHGNDEVAEVARNLNTMADSIEHNVTKLGNVAESRRVFIGNLAHEMKTPLTSILGFADILRIKRNVTDDDRIEYAGVIVSETRRLQSLSGKLMELLTIGNMQLTLEPVVLSELAEELSLALQPVFEKREAQFINTLSSGQIMADRELIKSLLYNLIDNSIKASSPGGSVWLGGYDVADTVTVFVEDQGIGIPADQIPMLTEPFYMVDKARTRKAGGAGLGLAICTEIARAHDTELTIASEQGRGTRVSVAFPKGGPAPTSDPDGAMPAQGAHAAHATPAAAPAHSEHYSLTQPDAAAENPVPTPPKSPPKTRPAHER